MKAMVLSKVGPATNLTLQEMVLPEPSIGQVRVKVAACGVCYRDILDRKGAFPFIQTPIVLGHEIAGTIDKIGDGVKRTVGEKVVSLHWTPCGECLPCRDGRSTHCDKRNESFLGLTANGGYSQYMIMGASGLVPVPEGFHSSEAASILCTYGTVWHSAITRGRLRAGEKVLITGATGGVGSAAVQMTKAMGCRVTAVTSSESKAEYLKRLGADEIIVAPEGKFRHSHVDLAFEAVGVPTFDSSFRSLRPGGRLVLIGNVTASEVKLKLGYPIIQELEIIGADSCTAAEMNQVFHFLQTTGIRPQIQQTLKLEEVAKAHQLLEDRKVSGRLVLQISDDW